MGKSKWAQGEWGGEDNGFIYHTAIYLSVLGSVIESSKVNLSTRFIPLGISR